MNSLFIQKSREYAMMAFLFLVPIFYIPFQADQRVVQERFFQAAVMGLGAMFLGNVWITLFIWLNLVLFAVNGASVGGSQVLSVFLGGVLFSCSRAFFKEQSFLKYAKPLYILIILNILMGIMQSLGIDPMHTGKHADGRLMTNETFRLVTGLFYLPAFYAIFASIVSAILINTGKARLGFALIFVALVARASTTLLAYAFLFIFYFRWHPKRPLWFEEKWLRWFNILSLWVSQHIVKLVAAVMFIGMLGAVAFELKTDRLTFLSRLESWHLVLRKSIERPFGWGPDSFRNYHKSKNFTFSTDEEYNPIMRERISASQDALTYYSADQGQLLSRFKGRQPKSLGTWSEAHNEYLQLFFEYGILGLILLYFFLKEIHDRFMLSTKNPEVLALYAVLVVYAISCIGQFPFHLARLSGIFPIFLGAFFAKTDRFYIPIKGA